MSSSIHRTCYLFFLSAIWRFSKTFGSQSIGSTQGTVLSFSWVNSQSKTDKIFYSFNTYTTCFNLGLLRHPHHLWFSHYKNLSFNVYEYCKACFLNKKFFRWENRLLDQVQTERDKYYKSTALMKSQVEGLQVSTKQIYFSS